MADALEDLLPAYMAQEMEPRRISRLTAAPDSLFEIEVNSNGELGVRDPDLEPGVELVLAPLYHIIDDAHIDLSTGETMRILGAGAQDSPRHLIVSSRGMIGVNSGATFRMDARGEEDESVPGCFFPLSEKHGASALRMKQNFLTRWRAALVTTFRPEKFSIASTRRVFLKFIEDLPVVAGEMNMDPVLNEPYRAGVSEGDLEHSDAGFWEITQVDEFHDARKPSKALKFDTFWLPCSLDVEVDDPTNAPCAMVHYPRFSTVRKVLEHADESKVWELVRSYSFLVKDEFLSEVERMAAANNVDTQVVRKGKEFQEFMKELNTRLGLKIEKALKECFCTFADGDCMLSLGRVTAHNSTMAAISLSSLPGSSGAPIFLLKPGLELMFFAVLNGPPLKAANYNLATSTNNPTFVLHYLTAVLGGLPPPSSEHWRGQGQQRRLHAFLRWLAQHIDTLKSVATSDGQLRWLQHVEELHSGRRTVL